MGEAWSTCIGKRRRVEEKKRAGVFGGVKYDARERGGERKRDVRGDSVACCVYYVTF